jgi:hypothetical protein
LAGRHLESKVIMHVSTENIFYLIKTAMGLKNLNDGRPIKREKAKRNKLQGSKGPKGQEFGQCPDFFLTGTRWSVRGWRKREEGKSVGKRGRKEEEES